MNIPRFFIGAQYIDEEKRTVVCQAAKLVKQTRKVLRLENGDRVDVLDGQGNIYHCILQSVSPGIGHDFFLARITSQAKIPELTKTRFTVALPLIKPNRFEWALEKLTELGVDKIVPIILHRSMIKIQPEKKITTPDLNQPSKIIRWNKIIQEAAEQCERASAPQLVPPLKFLDWLDQDDQGLEGTLRLICTERRPVQPLEEVLCNQKNLQKNSLPSCAIAIGAEGGFTEEEVEAALLSKFIPVSLGSLILRSETAAIYALSISKALLGLEPPGGTQ